VQAGADSIGVGDAAASLVGPEIYAEFVWPYEKKLVDGLHALGTKVRLHICGNTRAHLERMAALGCAMVDIDYPVSLAEARARMGGEQVLAGNLHPVAMLRDGSPAEVSATVAACHAAGGERYVVAAGCETPRDTPEENFRALCAYALTHKP